MVEVTFVSRRKQTNFNARYLSHDLLTLTRLSGNNWSLAAKLWCEDYHLKCLIFDDALEAFFGEVLGPIKFSQCGNRNRRLMRLDWLQESSAASEKATSTAGRLSQLMALSWSQCLCLGQLQPSCQVGAGIST